MPILTYSSSEGPRGGILNSRVLIGRRLTYGIAFSDPSVSRLHAWIDPVANEPAGWQIADAGSKTGTFVNDQKITRHHLQDGDIIRVGKSTLVFHDQETLPDGFVNVDLIAPPPVVLDSGILFQCACGAPLWVGNELAGKRGMCRHCRQPVTVPKLQADAGEPPPADPVSPPLADARMDPPPVAEPDPVEASPVVAPPQIEEPAHEEYEPADAPNAEVVEEPPAEEEVEQPIGEATASPPAAEPLGSPEESPDTPPRKKVAPAVMVDQTTRKKYKCAVCHSAIVVGEEMITCPDCAMTFHAECWQENLGCSSYGCPQVNCLQTRPQTKPIGGLLSEHEVMEDKPATRWELILLSASILGSAFGSVLFGSLPVIVLVICLFVLIGKKANRPGLVIGAILICALGIAGGLAVSDLLYFNARHVPPMIAKYFHF